MEVKVKKTRAPKTTNKQLEFLIAYMENHTAFATGKLLTARGKAVHDEQWKQLTENLNCLDGPSKGIDGWKKLWCDQRNQARTRAAKAKAAQKLTGNTGTPIQLKDFDLRILSIFGGESSIGLPVMEVGLGERPEDITDPSLLLGLTSNNISEANEKENEATITRETRNNKDMYSFPLCEEDSVLLNISNEQTCQTSNFNSAIDIRDTDKIGTSNLYQHTTVSQTSETASKQPLLTSNILTTQNSRKRVRSEKIDETQIYLRHTQDKQNECLQTMVGTLNRIASATEEQNELFKRFITLHEQTVTGLSTMVEVLNKRT
ncbi:PREDICTED: uncharacterized protein LOC105570996 [Vollenhovia emeryi]|uniref:uncharacterized protein LOC105570996 n=1 Tax=Vollenhovia emeryi TaxID=411798 RepID=UPI0005F56E9E|nr:PREDICTED: uncharacterized protein LOC105570996 [Vollenhovia emeryi]